jgi:secreted trypsin-like serine protease
MNLQRPKNHIDINFPTLPMQNGTPHEASTRIINGRVVNDDRYPYFTLLNQYAVCGAVLIGPRFVLSAAHCAGASDSLIVGARTSPQIGLATVGFLDALIHPNYLDNGFNFDIMIYYLEQPVTNAPYLTLGKDPIETVGQRLTVVGFGDTRGGGSGRLFLSDVLMETEVAYVDLQTCAKAHEGDPITDDMLCAKESDTDACFGDSGGPLILRGDAIEQDSLVGLVSWGRGKYLLPRPLTMHLLQFC